MLETSIPMQKKYTLCDVLTGRYMRAQPIIFSEIGILLH